MDTAIAHKQIQILTRQNELLEEMNSSIRLELEIAKQNSLVLHDILNFFVSIDRREQGQESEDSKEYLTELQKDGFKPSSG